MLVTLVVSAFSLHGMEENIDTALIVQDIESTIIINCTQWLEADIATLNAAPIGKQLAPHIQNFGYTVIREYLEAKKNMVLIEKPTLHHFENRPNTSKAIMQQWSTDARADQAWRQHTTLDKVTLSSEFLEQIATLNATPIQYTEDALGQCITQTIDVQTSKNLSPITIADIRHTFTVEKNTSYLAAATALSWITTQREKDRTETHAYAWDRWTWPPLSKQDEQQYWHQ